jgi:4-diphosphocytidyl-2-C-methyl-D-erythritol kinase
LTVARAPAKLNLALVVGPHRGDGRHELVTIMQPLALADEIELERGKTLTVTGFPEDTLVRKALELLARAGNSGAGWSVRIGKRIPVAAGLGGGSADAAVALRLANETLPSPLPPDRLHELAASVGADVPFFLEPGPKVAHGDGTILEPIRLPQDYAVLLLLPHGAEKSSTDAVYEAFDGRNGEAGFEERRAALQHALARVERSGDFAGLPRNDLATSPLTEKLVDAGAFRADVTGAGPAVYGLFDDRASAEAAEPRIRQLGRTWITEPAW